MDQLTITILEDGTVKIVTDKVSAGAHVSAERMLTEIESMLGGSTTVERRRSGLVHHLHEHQKETLHE